MCSKITRLFQVWGCAVLLSWTTLAFAQEAPEAAPAAPADDPLVVKPTTIAGKFSATLLMLKLARLDLAKYYLEQLLADNPTDADMLELRKAHGTGTFLQLTSVEALNPPAIELLNRLNQAIQNQISEPGYADALLDHLSGSPRERAEALAELQHLGPYAVPPILKRIAGKQHADGEVLYLTLIRLGSNASAPLIGGLASPDTEVRALSARGLGQVGSQADIAWLWAPAFQPDEATGVQTAAREAIAKLVYGDEMAVNRISGEGASRKMLRVASDYLSGKHKWPEQQDDTPAISVWTWNETAGTIVEHSVSRTQAGIFNAERLAREAAKLSPELEQASVILLASLLTREVERNQWAMPLPETAGGALDLAVATGPALCEQVLRYALDHRLPAAALGALQALRWNGSVELLSRAAPHGAVIAALDAPDQRVQFATAVTILHWDPIVGFRGSRRVVEILTRALNAEASPASVVMDPNVLRANETAGLFAELGFPAEMAATGQQGFQVAAQRGDIQLAVLHPNVIRWELSQTIANLRADARTASIPVVIYGPEELRGQFDRVSHEYQNVAFLAEGTVPVDISKHLRPMLALLSPPPVTAAERSQQISDASFWLRRIATTNRGNVFDLVPAQEAIISSLKQPDLEENSLISLGSIGSLQAQQALLQTVTAPAASPEMRTLAAAQLAFHLQRHGLLLTRSEVTPISDLYRNEQDPGLRTALASVIGALKPTPEAARMELLRSPQSSAPLENGQ